MPESVARKVTGNILTADWRSEPYWLDGLEREQTPNVAPRQNVDVVIVGSGYTGLNAAIETARGGRSTLVLDSGTPGGGCSSRNGGQISTSVKPSLEKLTAMFGADRALAIRAEGATSLEWIEDRIATEGFDCDFRRVGRFHAAHTPANYETLAREAETLRRTEGVDCEVVSRAEQRAELGSDIYHGGVVYARHASLHPARYWRGLNRAARRAGAEVIGDCAVIGIDRRSGGYEVTTEKGVIRARDVIVATNGYTGAATPWLRRRVIPIGSYIIATEPLPAELIDRLFPKDRIASDTCKVVYYFRASPDRTRVIFGGRVSAVETDPAISAPRLYADMTRIFPELSGVRVTHSWMGFVAYTFDEMAHTGVHDGVHYALGYCGSGVSMASYLGMRAGQKVLGLKEGATAFDDLPYPTKPLYRGSPWFLPPMVAWHRWRDRRAYQRARKAA